MKKLLLLFTFTFSLFTYCTAQFTDIVNFSGKAVGDSGTGPSGDVIRIGNLFYGTTFQGGLNNYGNIFSVDTNGNNYRDLYDFSAPGTTNGSEPNGTLTLSGGVLYATTTFGGINSKGNIFKIDTNGSGYKDLWDFDGGGDTNGTEPYGNVTLSGGKLYGMTSAGGKQKQGNIFSIDTNGGGYKDLWDFKAGHDTNGAIPYGSLTLVGSKLYGLTTDGGKNNVGVLFRIDTNGSGYKDLWDFSGVNTNGELPEGTLTFYGDVFYGMTLRGGLHANDGIIFRIDSNGNGFKDLWNFDAGGDTNGSQSHGLFIPSGSKLYGMTEYGGKNNDGNIFCIDTNGTHYNNLVNFNSTNGQNPQADVLLSGGNLYGMTIYGGTNNDGVLFSYAFLKVTATATATCYNSSMGSATVTVTGGISPYTYKWNDASSQTTATATGLLVPGTYTVYIHDNNDVEDSAVVSLTQPAALSVSVDNNTAVTCYNGADGSASATVTGGTTPYTYMWSNSQTTATATGLVAGTYTITATDACGDLTSATVTLYQAVTSITFSQENAVQNWQVPVGVTQVTVIVAGGAGAAVSGYNKAASFSGIVTVTPGDNISMAVGGKGGVSKDNDGNGGGGGSFVYDSNTTVLLAVAGGGGGDAYEALNSGATGGINLTNNTTVAGGGTDGSAAGGTNGDGGSAGNLDAGQGPGGGGTGWLSNGGNFVGTPTANPGTYSSFGGMDRMNYFAGGAAETQTSPDVNVGGYGGGGGGGYDAGGGGGGYNGAGGGNDDVNTIGGGGGGGGSYLNGTVVATPVANNSGNGYVTILYTGAPLGIVSTARTNVSCFSGTNGTATVTVSGGSTPYTYAWSDNQTTATASNLVAGTYAVNVIDACGGDLATASISIGQPANALSIAIATYTNVICNGGTGGATADTATGGAGPYIDLLDFDNSNGKQPEGSLTLFGTTLYGMTPYGGANGDGCLFSENINGTGYTDLLDFDNTNGKWPYGSLILSGTTLYGMTYSGGANNDGCIFSFNTNGNTYTNLFNFDGGTNGATPDGSLILSGTTLYGITQLGGTHGDGNVFSFNTNGNVYTDLLDFDGTNGSIPYGDLTLSGTTLYGMTVIGGAHNDGCVFAFNTNGSVYTDLLDFDGTNGATPYGSLTLSGTTLYGMARSGGVHSDGCVFSFNTSGNVYTDLLDFDGTNGNGPYGSLTLSGTTLYGMTKNGGTNGDGNVFSFNTSGNAYTDLFDFDGTNGENPYGSVTLSGTTLYGMTSAGGTNGDGTVFSVNPPYAYSWSPSGGSNLTATGLTAGTYTITVTDCNLCTAMASVTITAPKELRDSVSYTNIACIGGTVDATAKAGGGTQPYTYSWSDAQTNATATGLVAGTYSVSINDACGADSTISFTITQPSELRDSVTIHGTITCYGDTIGAMVNVGGGTTPYTYLWNVNNQKTAYATGLVAGSYSVIIYDACHTISAVFITITQPNALSAYIDTASNVSCNGGNNGSATATAAGGTTPYTYLWSNSQTSPTISNLVAGTYTVSVTDACGGDLATASVIIEQPANALAISIATYTNVICNGGTGGATADTATGGAIPYTDMHVFGGYNPNGGDPFGSLTLAGTTLYGMTSIGGANHEGCVFFINSDGSGYTDLLNFDGINGAYPNGSLTLSGTTLYGMTSFGGTHGDGNVFSFNTNGNTYTDLFDFDGGTNGLYPDGSLILSGTTLYGMTSFGGTHGDGNVFSFNTNGNVYTDLFDFDGTNGESPYGDLTLSGTTLYGMTSFGGTHGDGNVFSFNTNGNVYTDLFDFDGTNGESPYGDLTLSGTTLYGMTNAGGANDDGNVFSFNISGNTYTDLLDFNGTNGAIPDGSLTLSGTTLYGMTSLAGANGDGNVFSFNTSGNTYTDLLDFNTTNGATPYGSLTLSGTTLYGMTSAGGTNGDGNVFSVNLPYSYSWSPSGGSNLTATGLSGGTYTITVTDGNGCNAMASVTITAPTELRDSVTTTNIACSGSTGSATVKAGGGTLPYTYLWSNSQTTATITGLTAGTYSVSIKDACSADSTLIITITQPAVLTASVNITADISCNGGNNGSVTATVNGGSTPYTYLWSNSQTTPTISNLVAGTYSVIVTDACGGDLATASVILGQPTVLAIAIASYTNVVCNGGTGGATADSATGGEAPYADLHDFKDSAGAAPFFGPLALSGNTFYGTTESGGANGVGCIYSINKDGTAYTDLYDFIADSAGDPFGGVIISGNTLYGMTTFGGAHNNGNIFSFNLSNNVYTDLYDFVGTTGNSAYGNLTLSGTTLYGVTALGGIYSDGNIFSFNLSGNVFTDLYDFNGITGLGPTGTLALSSTGDTLYGTTLYGESSYGNIFSYSLSNNVCTDLFDFDGTNGENPYGSVIISGTTLYGMTNQGGVNFVGNIYSFNLSDNVCTDLYDFSDITANPVGNFILSGTTLYGTTEAGGTQGDGNVFAFNTTGNVYTDLFNFNSTTGRLPYCTLALSGTSLYGTTGSGGVNSDGTVFRINDPPYSYVWSPTGGTNLTATGLSGGTYTITVTDGNGCNAMASVTITQPSELRDSVSFANITCHGDTTTAKASVGGGNSPYTYLWSDANSQTTATATGLSAGTYSVIIQDNCGADSIATIIITQPASLGNSAEASTLECSGGTAGVSANASGGVQPYTYSWSGGQATDTVTGLSAGTYSVSITDACGGDLSTAIVTINSPATVFKFPQENTIQNFTVPAGITQLTITAIGGAGGSTGSGTSGGNGATITGLVSVTPGDVIDIVTGGVGATTNNGDGAGGGGGSFVWDVTSSTLLEVAGGGGGAYWSTPFNGYNASTTTTPAGSNGGTGEGGGAAVSSEGGGGGAGYLSNGGSFAGGLAGVGGNDQANGFTGGAGYSGDISTVGGYGGGGGAGYDDGGGGGGYNGGGSGSNNGGGGGSSYVNGSILGTSLDTNSGNGFVSISFPITPLVLNATSNTNVTCNGNNNGTATVNVGGGTTPYTYLWSDPNSQTTQIATGLSAGTYSVSITDACGADTMASFTITQPVLLGDSISVLANISCYGNSAGIASVYPSGGILPYTYLWSDNNSQTTDTATGLVAGSYQVEITDANGCTDYDYITITQPMMLHDSVITISNLTCYGTNSGSVSVSPKGGTLPYTYLWNGGQTTDTITGLSAGTYSVSVRDSCGDLSTASVLVLPPSTIAVFTQENAVQNWPVPAGVTQVTIAVSGAAGGVGGPGASFTGIYNVIPGDNISMAVGQQGGLSESDDGNGGGGGTFVYDSNTTVLLAVGGGGGGSAYGYAYGNGLPGLGGSGGLDIINNTTTGGYGINSSAPGGVDSLGGSGGNLDNGSGPGAGGAGWSGNGGNYTGYYFANGGYDKAGFFQGGAAETVSGFDVNYGGYGGGGGGGYDAGGGGGGYNGGGGGNDDTLTIGSGGGGGASYSKGTILLSPSANNYGNGTVTISYPNSALGVTIASQTNILCNGNTTGSVTSSVSGGVSPYTYTWSGGAGTNSNASGLSAGSYTLNVNDANGCSVSATVSITQPSELRDSVSITNVTCNGGTGSAIANVSGGTSPYNYLWSDANSQTTATATGLVAGTYSVSIKDACGADSTISFTITQPSELRDSVTVNNINCAGGTGSATANVVGGSTPYTYMWSNSQTTATVTGLTVGTYSVSIKDACAADSTLTITINSATALGNTSVIILANVSCNGGNNGSASVNPSGGGTPYTYTWSNGETVASATGLSAGTYSVSVKDGCGADSLSHTITITQPNALGNVIASVTSNVNCNGNADGSASSTITGGTLPYTYTWTPSGGNNSSASNLSAGTYTLTIRDACGNLSTSSVVITEPTAVIITTDSTVETATDNGTATVNVSGGIAPYTYSWSPGGGTTSTISGLSAGSYCCTVSDVNGCAQTVCVTVKSTLGIDNISNASNISIYPNPTIGSFTITGVTQGQVIELYDYLGQKLSSTPVSNNATMHFDISTRANGVYLIRILNTDGTLATERKMIKTE